MHSVLSTSGTTKSLLSFLEDLWQVNREELKFLGMSRPLFRQPCRPQNALRQFEDALVLGPYCGTSLCYSPASLPLQQVLGLQSAKQPWLVLMYLGEQMFICKGIHQKLSCLKKKKKVQYRCHRFVDWKVFPNYLLSCLQSKLLGVLNSNLTILIIKSVSQKVFSCVMAIPYLVSILMATDLVRFPLLC